MIATLDDRSITLNTRATPKLLAILSSMEGRRAWLKGGGLRLENTPHNLAQLKEHYPDLVVQGDVPDDDIFDVPVAPLKFGFKREPDPHQLTAFERCRQRRYFALFMEQGTGKTKVAIDRAAELFSQGHITGALVVSKKGVHRQWIDAELDKDCAVPHTADWWHNKPVKPELLVAGDTLKWWSINYDALRSDKAFSQVLDFCRVHSGRLLIIADESQCIMNHTSQRHKRMIDLKPFSSHRMILTGTPIAKDLTDEWAQMRWLDESILSSRYLTTFRAQYCIMGGFEGRVVIGHKNLSEFKAKTGPYSYRVTKEEIGYIPKRYSDWIYDLTSEQKRLIQQVRKELLAELEHGDVVEVKSANVAFMKAQQIANGFIINEERGVQQIMPTDKNPRIISFMEWLDSHEGKVVVWTRFIHDRAMVAEALAAAGISNAEYTGSDAERHDAKARFISDESVRVFLANPQSAGTGLDGLQTVCSQAVYYSNGFNSIDRWQSEDRIDRRGMIGGSHYTDIIGKGSPDRYILRNLKKKKGISAMTLDDINEAFEDLV